ncbi:MAG: HAD-IC family P-type ATPase [Candidatus Omnitrophica bacterium]|nr:HAD-IC family P-type ATPase [Candidatus Omnitrophota bacterium]
MKISELVSKDSVNINLKSRTKKAAIAEIIDQLYKTRKIKNKEEVLKAILKRESENSTGIGHGLAIPHARIENLREAMVFIGISKHGIDFSSLDAKPVYIVVLFLTPLFDTATHLKILSRLGVMFNDGLLLGELRSASSSNELYFILKQGDLERDDFRALNKEEIFLELETSADGLTETEAKSRLGEYGSNRLKRIKKTPLLVRFVSHFTNLLAILMWLGSGLSFWAQMPEAGWACIAVIFINAIFSFWQEFKAEKAIEALKGLLPSYARVIRGGEEKKVLLSDLVPGDIIFIEEGDSIPADARIIEAQELRVNNSAFSGESKLSHKIAEGFETKGDFLWLEIPNLVFAGTSVASGMGKAVVIATGMGTEIGKIAYLTQTIKEELSPLQREVNRISKLIAAISVIMGFAFFFVGLAFTKMTLIASTMFAIGIILANVPQGLMPTLTLALSMAVQRMARKHALIKKLSSVETLGCTSVICTDKTGTLTTNQMSVRKIWINQKVIEISGTGYEPVGSFNFEGKELPPDSFTEDNLELLLRIGSLCNTAKLVVPSESQNYWSIIGDPTEGALLTLAQKAGFNSEQERKAHILEKRFPFDSVRKRMSCINKLANGELNIFVKGAPKELLDLSTKIILGHKIVELTAEIRTEIISRINNFAEDGLRVLGFAYRKFEGENVAEVTVQTVENDLIFIGITAMYDPPRPEVKDAVAICKRAGIRVVMITGDYQVTALSIAKQVGIVNSEDAIVITGAEFSDIDDDQLKERLLKQEVVFARVNPEHKLRVVNIFKDLGNIVAVTGDGVNDAPALKRADIGVAMGLRGTDVAKESAEMILTDDNFASIVSAIEEGRAVFDNIKKFITYIFAHLVPEAIPYIFYALLKIPVPITVMQILAIDLGTETIPALALGVEKPEPGIMELAPRPRKKGVIDKIVLFRGYIVLGLLNTAAVLSAYYFVLFQGGWKPGMQLEPNDTTFTNPLHLKAMTIVFVGIVVMQIANIFACRSEKYSAFKLGFFNNKLILWGILFELVFASVIIYTPFAQKIFNTIGLGWQDWGILFAFMIVVFFLEELRKKMSVLKR